MSPVALLSAATQAVLEELPDVVLAYGQSDEYSFVLRKLSQLYERRARCAGASRANACASRLLTLRAPRSKLTSVIVSLFTSHYVMRWHEHLPDTPLRSAPARSAREKPPPAKPQAEHH